MVEEANRKAQANLRWPCSRFLMAGLWWAVGFLCGAVMKSSRAGMGTILVQPHQQPCPVCLQGSSQVQPHQQQQQEEDNGKGIMEPWFKQRNTGPLVWKWMHYFDVYERHFAKFRNAKRINLLEFGVNAGGSIDLWRNYFGPGLHYYGVDINPACKQFAAPDVTIIIGDQTSRASLQEIREQIPDMDIIIDDGGHSDKMQVNTFMEMFQKVQPEGVYVCEDLFTSFVMPNLRDNGGFSMIDMAKDLIDKSQAWLLPPRMQSKATGYVWDSAKLEPVYKGTIVKKWPIDDFVRLANNVHVYRGMVVVEKDPKSAAPPKSVFAGSQNIKCESASGCINSSANIKVKKIKKP